MVLFSRWYAEGQLKPHLIGQLLVERGRLQTVDPA